MLVGIADVYYNVSDIKKATAFYRDLLGLKVTYETEHWVSLELAGVRIGLHWTEGKEVPYIPRDSHGSFAGATITFETDDILFDSERLKRAGVKILGSSDNPWGKICVFEDCDGNVLKLMQR